jgi:hypothetical protein
MTRTELIRIAKQRHQGDNWITAFAGEIGVSYWTIYRIANNQKAKVSELVKLKIEKVLGKESV